MHTPEEVRQNVATAIAAFEQPTQEEKEALAEVQQILEPIKDFCWQTGRPENN